jgi:succinate dehydrogenase / fumarate reductase cytochrome b subunit
MSRVFGFYRSSVGKKILMALTGLVLFGFVLGHMAGNLKAFLGAEEFNAYAEGLRSFGAPLIPHGYFLWAARLGLIVALVVHVITMVQLWAMAGKARPKAYQKAVHLEDGISSRTMRLGGVVIVSFVVYHLLHMTIGSVHPNFVAGDAYGNLIAGFQSVPVAVAYSVAVVALGLHLHHGIWSIFQSLGLNHPKYNHLRRSFAFTFTIVVVVGFLTIPVSVTTGFLQ